ncbi:hypothetical protein GCM10012286_08020 [Streptomyces lasiicapitis]|uniref:Uncharacterized protein n=1 Tax=Streptomyces lasiicapitis TaxID=1923961 RepID=A0ABQ2LJ02_9ACTN|nr:hypothetical protein GCM10012286_08020 [Streptomyces lasiicapitis]
MVSQADVPSASGPSAGIVYADTTGGSTRTYPDSAMARLSVAVGGRGRAPPDGVRAGLPGDVTANGGRFAPAAPGTREFRAGTHRTYRTHAGGTL